MSMSPHHLEEIWLTLADGSSWKGLSPSPDHAVFPAPRASGSAASSRFPLHSRKFPHIDPQVFPEQNLPLVPIEGETVFTTASCGYPQSLSDPSYCGQILVFAFPPVGIYGVDLDGLESRRPWVSAAVMGEYEWTESSPLAGLAEWLASWNVPLVTGMDTRGLILTLREKGTLMGRLAARPEGPATEELPRSLLSRVSGGEVEVCGDGPTTVALLDYGAKQGILRSLTERGCRVVRFPAGIDAASVRSWNPDGIVLSNGPGDPADCDDQVDTIRELLGSAPILGICLGNQLLARACGAGTKRLLYGHRGANQPVMDCETGRGFLTSQNHGYTVDESSLPGTDLEVSYRHLGDGTVEGIRHRGFLAEGVQFHPEASPGPRDAAPIFDAFLAGLSGHGSGSPLLAETAAPEAA